MKKLFKEKQFNLGIVESYKPVKDKDSPVLGSFSVNGMAVENQVSQNRTRYSSDVWSQPTAFGKGGKFINEDGKLKPSTLFGSLDHPLDNRADLTLKEAAIAWNDIKRNSDGSWDGVADILNNPHGRIVKTILDYAKLRGGGDLLGVSSRAVGESQISEANGTQIEDIVPETFELMAFDFVYNPSFQTAVARINESKKGSRTLIESVRSLAEEDQKHAEVYEDFIENLEKVQEQNDEEDNKGTKDMSYDTVPILEGKSLSKAKENYLKELHQQEKKLHDAIYDLKMMTDEEFAKNNNNGSRDRLLSVLKKEYEEVLEEINSIESVAEESRDTKTEKYEDSKYRQPNKFRGKTVIGRSLIETSSYEAVYRLLHGVYSTIVFEDKITYKEVVKFFIKLYKMYKYHGYRDDFIKIQLNGLFKVLSGRSEIPLDSYNLDHMEKEIRTNIPYFMEIFKQLKAGKKRIKVASKKTRSGSLIFEAEEPTEEELEAIEKAGEEAAEGIDNDEELEDEELEDEEPEDEETEDEEPEITLDSIAQELSELKEMVEAIKDILLPVEDPETIVDDEELEDGEPEEEPEDEEPEEDEELEDEEGVIQDMDEEDLEDLSDEELEWLANKGL